MSIISLAVCVDKCRCVMQQRFAEAKKGTVLYLQLTLKYKSIREKG